MTHSNTTCVTLLEHSRCHQSRTDRGRRATTSAVRDKEALKELGHELRVSTARTDHPISNHSSLDKLSDQIVALRKLSRYTRSLKKAISKKLLQ